MGALIELNRYILLRKGKLLLDCGKVRLYNRNIVKMSRNFNRRLKLSNWSDS